MNSNDNQFFVECARQDLLSFCVYTDKFFEISEHHEKIASALNKLYTGEIQNLIISMPPRAGKSRIMQEFISYLYGKKSNTDILYTGHSLSLLQDFSRNIRNRISSDEYKLLFSSSIAGDNSAVNSWKIKNGGMFSIFGVGGGITGKGGDIMIIDDPYASRQDAESDTIRRTVSNWYWSTFLSRKQNDKAKQIIIMQRWREDDLVGEILEREGEKWTELKIPALDEQGESFWSKRFSKEYFEDIKSKSPLFFQSQYQQDPINEGTGDFKKEYFKYYQGLPEGLELYTFIDPAISQKQEADNTAIVTVGIDRKSNNLYIIDVVSGKFLPNEIIDKVFQVFLQHHPVRIGIEVVAYQKMLALEIKNQMQIRNIFFVLDEVHPQGEKQARIRSILQPRYTSLSIYHNADKTQDLELELLKFPNGKHDDIIDSLSGSVSMIQSHTINRKPLEIYVPNTPGTAFDF